MSLPLRVTFYARVSTEFNVQLNSLDNQITYYTDFIKSNPNWEYVEGYVDEGISGVSTAKRERFNEMIEDGKQGLFDLVITKEVSRFARNTLDSIRFTRELLSSGVAVFFKTITSIPLTRTANCDLQLCHQWHRTSQEKYPTVLDSVIIRQSKTELFLARTICSATTKKTAS